MKRAHEVLRGKMRDKLDMGILREVANTLLSMVVGAGVETAAEARAILPPTREVLEFVLYLSRWWQDLHEEPRFREQTLRCFVRSFELLSLAGQLKRDEVADTGPLPTYRLSLRHQALDEFRKWAEARAEEISEFHGSVAVVLSAGLLLLGREVLEDDMAHLVPGLRQLLRPRPTVQTPEEHAPPTQGVHCVGAGC